MKQMFGISEQLIAEQSDVIFWSEYNYLGRFFMETNICGNEEVIISHTRRFMYFQIQCCLGKMDQNPTSNSVWEEN